MSWLGDSFSSFTGQLTNFTKEVLSEGREEISDHAAEIRVLQERFKELEVHVVSEKKEVERLQKINGELDARAESAELQVKTLSRDYRQLLQEKENEINNLQQKYQEMQELHERIITGPNQASSPSYHSSNVSFATGDEMDFSDVISSQHEINRLYDTVRRLQVERDHWKHLATHNESSSKFSVQNTNDESKQLFIHETNKQLESRIKDLESQLHTLVDDHHRELGALHDIYSEKLISVKQSHANQISDLESQLEELKRNQERITFERNENDDFSKIVALSTSDTKHNKYQTLQENGQDQKQTIYSLEIKLQELQEEKRELENSFKEVQAENENIKKTIVALHMSEKELQNQLLTAKQVLQSETHNAALIFVDDSHLSVLQNKLTAAEMKIGELLNEREQICCDLYATKHKLLAQLHSSHASNAEMLLEVQLARQKFSSEIENAQSKLSQEKQELSSSLAEIKQHDKNLKKSVEEMEINYKDLNTEQDAIIEYLGDTEHQELVAGAIHALELENKVLKQNYEKLQQQFQILQQEADLSKFIKDKTSNEFSLHRTDSDKTLENTGKKEEQFDTDETTPKYSLRKNRSGSNISEKSETINLQASPELEEFETSSYASSFSELSLRNKELDDQVRLLQSQIESHERDIEHFEMVKADWQMEKNALEEVLTRLRTQLRVKEMSLSLITAQRGLLEVKKQSPRAGRNKKEDSTSEELELGIEINHLQEQVEQLTQCSAQLENERDILMLEKEKLLEELHKVNKQNKGLMTKLQQMESSELSSNKTDDVKEQVGLQLRIKELEESICYITTERDSLATGLEDLAKNHQHILEELVESRNKFQRLYEEKTKELEALKIENELNKTKLASLNEKSGTAVSMEDKTKKLAQDQLEDEKELLLEQNCKLLSEINNVLLKASLSESVEKPRSEEVSHTILELLQDLISANEYGKLCLQEKDVELKRLEDACKYNEELIRELEMTNQTIENLQRELAQTKDEKTHSLWEVESWVDISETTDKNDKENNLTTKLQDLELESTSSKQSKDSSDDNHEKYGELVQRKEDLELQIKELENKLSLLHNQMELQEKGKENDKKTTIEENQALPLNKRRTDLLAEGGEDKTEILNMNSQLKEKNSVEINPFDICDNQIVLSLRHFINLIQQNQSFLLDDVQKLIKGFSILNSVIINHLDEYKAKTQGDKETFEFKELGDMELNFDTILDESYSLDDVLEMSQLKSFLPETEQLKNMYENWRNVNLKLQDMLKELYVSVNHIMKKTVKVSEENLKLESNLKEHNILNTKLEEKVNSLGIDLQSKAKQLQTVTDILNVYKENLDVDESAGNYNTLDNAKELMEKKDNQDLDKEKEMEKIESFFDLDKHLPEELEKRICALQKEKEQIMSILNEKSRENGALKAEVHQLMDFVSAGKNEISRLQQDNEKFKKERKLNDEENSEMTKEAVQNLARIIRDKDMEMEALNQKNQTLLTILQQSSPEGTHIQSILQERENLTKQINMYQTEREQIICALTQKHQESTSYHAEIQRLMNILSNETQKVNTLQQQHSKIVKQYEDKQKALINTQNELINLKQRVTELEEQQTQMKTKYIEFFKKKDDDNESDASTNLVQDFLPKSEVNDMAKLLKEKEQWLLEKDKLLYEYQQQIHQLKEIVARRDEEITTLKHQVDHLMVQINSYQSELREEKLEREAVEQKLQDMCSKASILNESNNRFSMTIHEKEFELNTLKEKVSTLTELIQQPASSDESKNTQEIKEKFLIENEMMQRKMHEFQQERDQVMLTLNQRQQENRELQNDLLQIREREKRLQNELERLRKHLLQIEESYTQEALHAEEREKELRTRLAHAEEKARNFSSSYSNASFQANQQLESLQEQLLTVAQQRDNALLKLDQTDDKVQQLTASLHTLQIVLERFQQEKEFEIAQQTEEYKKILDTEKQVTAQLKQEIQFLQQKLAEARDALDAASRLSEKLDDKEESIISLKQAVMDRDSALKRIQDEMNQVHSSTEGKIDKLIVKNLVVNYLSVPPNQRLQVLRIIGTVLDFNLEERTKVGLENKKWISGWFKPSSPQHTTTTNQSLSAAFIQFLENESQPVPTLKLPTEITVQTFNKKVEPVALKPFTMASRSSINLQQNHLLMKPMTGALPTFTPIPVSEHGTIVNNILKEMF